MCRTDHHHHCHHVTTILTSSSLIDVSPLPSLHPLIPAEHHTEFPLDNSPQWHSSSLTAPTIIHSSILTASPSRALHEHFITLLTVTLPVTHVSLTLFTLSPDCTSNKDISKMDSYTSRTFPPTYLDDGQLHPQT